MTFADFFTDFVYQKLGKQLELASLKLCDVV